MSDEPVPYVFYLARCADGSLYAGICRDAAERERAHNEGRGAKYTRSRGPVRIIHTETLPDKSAALKREAEVKGWPKAKKESLVRGNRKRLTPSR
jgi:putative endonuclease